MKKLLLLFITISLLSCRSSRKAYRATDMTAGLLRNVISEWPMNMKETAVDMIRKYGQPSEVTLSMLIWNNNGPWVRTVVARDETNPDHFIPPQDFLQQTIHYKVPPDKYDDLARYDATVIVDR